MTEQTMIERVALALEPKCRAFGGGDMPTAVAREFASAVLCSKSTKGAGAYDRF